MLQDLTALLSQVPTGKWAAAVMVSAASTLLAILSSRIRRWVTSHFAVILDAAAWHLGRLARQSIARRATLRRYARIVLSSNRYLEAPNQWSAALALDENYVELKLQDPREITLPAIDVLLRKGARNVLILGDPGSGKSSLLRRTLRDAAEELLARQRGTIARLPLIIELKSLAAPSDLEPAKLGAWLMGEIRGAASATDAFDIERVFDVCRGGDGILVLLDGLDEVSTEAYPRIVESIRQLTRHLAQSGVNNEIVLTMRTQFFQLVSGDFESTFHERYKVTPFTSNEISEYLWRYPFPQQSRTSSLARLHAAFSSHPTLKEMCANPLLLAMYVGQDQRSPGSAIPDSRTSFLEAVAAELIVNRRSRQLSTTSRTALKERRESILGRLALGNLTATASPTNLIDRTAALAEVAREYPLLSQSEIGQNLDELIRDTGLLNVSRGGNSLAFINLTFCAFFAAKESAANDIHGWRAVRAQYSSYTSRSVGKAADIAEVLPYTAALLPRASRLLALDDLTGDHSIEPSVLAKCLIETQAYSHSCLESYVKLEFDYLRSVPPSRWDESWRQRLQLFVTVIGESELQLAGQSPALPDPAEILSELSRGERANRLQILKGFLSHDSAAALRIAEAFGLELSREAPDILVEACQDPVVLAKIIDQVRSRGTSDHLERCLLRACLSYRSAATQAMLCAASEHSMSTPHHETWKRLGRHWVLSGQANRQGADIPRRHARRRETLFTQLLTNHAGSMHGGSLSGVRRLTPVDRLIPAWALTAPGLLTLLGVVTWPTMGATSYLVATFAVICTVLGLTYGRTRDHYALYVVNLHLQRPSKRGLGPRLVGIFYPALASLERRRAHD